VLDSDYTLDADGESDFTNPLGHQGLRHDVATPAAVASALRIDPMAAQTMEPTHLN